MATQPNVLTNEQILAELNQFTNNQQTPKIKIGDQEFSAENAQAIQAAIDAANTRNQSEFTALKEKLAQLENTRVVKPTEPSVTTTTSTNVENTPRKPRQLTDEEWTQDFIKAPQRVFDETIARMLNVEGSGSEVLRSAFGAVAANLQKADLERQALLTAQQGLDEKINSSQAERHAEKFLDKHPDFEINETNKKIMGDYLTEYGLPATEKNLALIYNQAVADGKIQKKQTEETQQNQLFTQTPQRIGVPRLGGQSSGNVDDKYIVEQASKLSADEQFALIQRLKGGQFQR